MAFARVSKRMHMCAMCMRLPEHLLMVPCPTLCPCPALAVGRLDEEWPEKTIRRYPCAGTNR